MSDSLVHRPECAKYGTATGASCTCGIEGSNLQRIAVSDPTGFSWTRAQMERDEELSALRARVEELEREHQFCSVCLGKPLASGKPCVCNGVGTAEAQVNGLYEVLNEHMKHIDTMERERKQSIEQHRQDLATFERELDALVAVAEAAEAAETSLTAVAAHSVQPSMAGDAQRVRDFLRRTLTAAKEAGAL